MACANASVGRVGRRGSGLLIDALGDYSGGGGGSFRVDGTADMSATASDAQVMLGLVRLG